MTRLQGQILGKWPLWRTLKSLLRTSPVLFLQVTSSGEHFCVFFSTLNLQNKRPSKRVICVCLLNSVLSYTSKVIQLILHMCIHLGGWVRFIVYLCGSCKPFGFGYHDIISYVVLYSACDILYCMYLLAFGSVFIQICFNNFRGIILCTLTCCKCEFFFFFLQKPSHSRIISPGHWL